MPTLDDLITARAGAMADHDGAPVGTVHIIGAAAQLQAELISARDRLLAPPAAAPTDEAAA